MRVFHRTNALRLLAALLASSVLGAQESLSYDLVVGVQMNGADAKPLAGQALEGSVYIRVVPEAGVETVRFYLDDPAITGTVYRVERNAPFDLAGGSRTESNAFNVDSLAVGSHTVTASVELVGGSTVVLSGTFESGVSTPVLQTIELSASRAILDVGSSASLTVSGSYSDGSTADLTGASQFSVSNRSVIQISSGTPAVLTALAAGSSEVTASTAGLTSNGIVFEVLSSTSAYELIFETSTKDSSPEPLEGAAVTGLIYVALAPPDGVDSVRFYLDDIGMQGTPFRVETNPPFDFNGGSASTPNAFDTGDLAVGAHSISALVLLESGASEAVSAEFSVQAELPGLVSLDLSLGAVTLHVAETSTAQVIGNYSDGSSANLSSQASFTVSNPTVARVADGMPRTVTALATGVCQIRASVNGVSSNSVSLEILAVVPPAEESQYSVRYRSAVAASALALDGAVVTGAIFVTLEPTDGADSVRFYLDDPKLTGDPFHSEGSPPFDFNGGTSTAPTAWNSASALDGEHAISAAVLLLDGTEEVVHADFRVANDVSSLAFSPSSIARSFTADDPGSASTLVLLSATNGGSAAFDLTHDGGSWLSLSAGSGNLPASFTVSVDSAGLDPGIYQAVVTASAAGYAERDLIVSLTVGTGAAEKASSVSQNGITWTFDVDYPVGKFVNGDWYVVGPVTVESVSPAWDGEHHGSMINPEYGAEQAYDDRPGAPNFESTLRATFPREIDPGESLVSAWCWKNTDADAPPLATTPGSSDLITRPMVRSAAVLTVVESAPPAGSFRPAYGGTDKTLYNVSQLQTDILPSLPAPSGVPDMDDLIDRVDRVWLDHTSKWRCRFITPSEHMQNYARDHSADFNDCTLGLMLDAPADKKEQLLVRCVQIGIDYYGILKTGALWGNHGGGLGSGRKWPILFAGVMLDDSEMMNCYKVTYDDETSQEDCQTYYDSSGTPSWHSTHCFADQPDPAPGYRTCCTANAWVGSVLGVHILKGETGIDLKDLWDHDVLFDYMDMYMDEQTPGTWQRSWSDFAEDMWDEYRADYGALWSGP